MTIAQINERRSLIALAGPTDVPRGPGRFEGCSDPELAAALDSLYLDGSADEMGGSTDEAGHGARFGRFVLVTDSQGFVDVEVFETPLAAGERIAELNGDPVEDEDVIDALVARGALEEGRDPDTGALYCA